MEDVIINGVSYQFSEDYEPHEYYDSMISFEDYIVGNAILSLTMYRLNIKRTRFYFNRLKVNPEFQGRGIGSFLLERALAFARREKIAIITTVNPYGNLNLEQLTDFCIRHGFRAAGDGALLWLPN